MYLRSKSSFECIVKNLSSREVLSIEIMEGATLNNAKFIFLFDIILFYAISNPIIFVIFQDAL